MNEKRVSCPNFGRGGWYAVCVAILTALLLMGLSCATKEKVIVERSGIKGTVVPIDGSGNEIKMQDRGGIIISCTPVRNGTQEQEKTVTANASGDGSFYVDLQSGEYLVEIFLEGFYVKSFHLDLKPSKPYNLGKITLQKIEAGEGMPFKDGEQEEITGSEGDVNIQPPAM